MTAKELPPVSSPGKECHDHLQGNHPAPGIMMRCDRNSSFAFHPNDGQQCPRMNTMRAGCECLEGASKSIEVFAFVLTKFLLERLKNCGLNAEHP